MSNFSDYWTESAATAEGEALAAGEYHVEVTEAGTETTPKSGKELARLRLRVLDGDAGSFEHVMFFTSKLGTERAAKTLYAFGVAVGEVRAFAELDVAMQAIVGTRAHVFVSYREVDDKRYRDLDVLDATPPQPATQPTLDAADDEPTPF